MGWLIGLGILLLLALLPIGVRLQYDAVGLAVRMLVGPLSFLVYASAKPKKTRRRTPKRASHNRTQHPTSQSQGGRVTDFVPLMHAILDFLGELRKKLRVRRLVWNWCLAGKDPCDVAIQYARAWATVGTVLPVLERAFVIQSHDGQITCDFSAHESVITVRVDLTISIGRLFSLGMRHGIHTLREFLHILHVRKGGAVS